MMGETFTFIAPSVPWALGVPGGASGARISPGGPRRGCICGRAECFRNVGTLAYTQVVVDPRLAEAVQKAFALRPKIPIHVAGSRGSGRK